MTTTTKTRTNERSSQVTESVTDIIAESQAALADMTLAISAGYVILEELDILDVVTEDSLTRGL